MSVRFAKRLREERVFAPQLLHRALFEGHRRAVSGLERLVRLRPEMLGLLEECTLGWGPAEEFRPARDLMAQLPEGMCERLMAFPVHFEGGQIEIVAADPEDRHVREEFEFHLGMPVQLRRGSVQQLLAASGVQVAGPPSSVHRPVRVGSAIDPDELARTNGDGDDAERRARRTTNPGLGQSIVPPPTSRPPGSTRGQGLSIESVQTLLTEAWVPDDVARILTKTGPGTVVFTVRDEELSVRAVSGVDGRPDVTVLRDEVSVMRVALDHGEYLGPLFDSPAHQPLSSWLPRGGSVFAAPIYVRERPTLLLLLDASDGDQSTRLRGRRLAGVAARALEDLIVRRKRSGQA